FLHHAHRAFANFRGIFGCFSFVHHDSILLEKGASSKSGAVQVIPFDHQEFQRLVQIHGEKARRQMDLVEMAKEVLGDLLS
ncbi:MAG: hypothetical protein WCY91_02240, partial [Acidithiobacillus sp.]